MHSTLNSVITQTLLPMVVFGIQSSEHGDKCESATETEAEEEKKTHTQILYGISIFYSDALYLLFLSFLPSRFLFLLLSFTW